MEQKKSTSPKPRPVQKYTFKEPENPQVNVSSKKNPKSYKLICKIILKKFGFVELRSLGNAAESTVKLAEMMVRNRFAEFEKIESSTTNLEDINNDSGVRQGIQFCVKLKKSKEFDSLFTELE